MNVRKVVLTEPRVLDIVETEMHPPAEHQALVRLCVAGICGSDLSAYRGTSALVTYPRVLGHEVLMRVIECPDRPDLVGRRAVLDPMIPCRRCRACAAGRTNCCVRLRVMGVHIDGGLQELWTVGSHSLFPIPDSMPDEVAVLAEPLTIAYQAVKRSSIQAGQIGVVLGAGAIGLLIACLLVRGRGCRAVVVDLDEQRLRTVRSIGAIAIHAESEELKATIAGETGGDMADVVFEASGSPMATRMTTELVAHAGKIVLVGWNRGPVEVDTVTLMRKEVDLLGSRNSVNAFPAAIRLLDDGIVDPGILITHRFTIAEVAQALHLLDTGVGNPLKVLVEAE